MKLLNPKSEKFEHLDEPSRQIMLQTIAFFENKGKARLKHDDHERVWYRDFLDFLKENRIFSSAADPDCLRRKRLPLGYGPELRFQRDTGVLWAAVLVHLAGYHSGTRPDLDGPE